MLFRSSSGGAEWMIVFLGNAGPRYNGTRHNVGFAVGDILAKRCGVSINRLRSRALTARANIGGHDVLLVKPQTFMNLSGEAVRPLADYFKISPERVLVVSDEVALVPGRLRLRASGSAGGHNGLKNIILHLGTENFPRLRVGVGSPPHPDYDMADWVMGVPRGEDAAALEKAEERAAENIGDGFSFSKLCYNILAEQQPCRGGDPHKASGHAAAARRRRFAGVRLGRLLGRIHHRQVRDPPAAQLAPNNAREGTSFGFGEVGQTQKRSVLLVAGAECRNEPDTSPGAAHREIDLAGYEIDAVYNEVRLQIEQRITCFGRVSIDHRENPALGRYITQTLRRRFRFRHIKRGG